MSSSRGFASDNNAGIHPEILVAIARANTGHARAYGDDAWTAGADQHFKRHFGERARAFPVFNGTGANVLALRSILQPYQAVICTDTSHIQVDECGAPEAFTGCKLVAVAGVDGKLTPEGVEKALKGRGDQHHVQPRVISISQTTELGAVYTAAELKALTDFAHAHGLLVHLDGARISNAAAALGLPFRAFTTDVGVDCLSFGGTKNGLLLGEAVVFLNPALGEDFRFHRKQGMQLSSKMRFISAQFEAYFSAESAGTASGNAETDELWLRSANHANRMGARLAAAVKDIPGIRISRPVQANAVFAFIPKAALVPLQQEYFFYPWSETALPIDGRDCLEVRWMASFDTTEEDITGFANAIRRCPFLC